MSNPKGISSRSNYTKVASKPNLVMIDPDIMVTLIARFASRYNIVMMSRSEKSSI